jgi:hypothetical protein
MLFKKRFTARAFYYPFPPAESKLKQALISENEAKKKK